MGVFTVVVFEILTLQFKLLLANFLTLPIFDRNIVKIPNTKLLQRVIQGTSKYPCFYLTYISYCKLYVLTAVVCEKLPVAESIQSSLNFYLKWNLFSGKNGFFCKICSSNNQALADKGMSKVGDYLIIPSKAYPCFLSARDKGYK